MALVLSFKVVYKLGGGGAGSCYQRQGRVTVIAEKSAVCVCAVHSCILL